jgi:hypothetical protein
MPRPLPAASSLKSLGGSVAENAAARLHPQDLSDSQTACRKGYRPEPLLGDIGKCCCRRRRSGGQPGDLVAAEEA